MDEWVERRRDGIRKVLEIDHRYRNRTMEEEDFALLFLKSRGYYYLAEIADRDWARYQSEIMAKDLEIEELKRQIQERQ